MFESKNVFGLMYGKNPTFFLLSFVALRNAFAASETQDHNDICYLLSIWLRYTLLANYSTSCALITFMSVIHSDISPRISGTKSMFFKTFLLFSQTHRIYLNVYFPSASIGFAILREGYAF